MKRTRTVQLAPASTGVPEQPSAAIAKSPASAPASATAVGEQPRRAAVRHRHVALGRRALVATSPKAPASAAAVRVVGGVNSSALVRWAPPRVPPASSARPSPSAVSLGSERAWPDA